MMESKPQTQSVIAKLMGLDDMPHQQPVHTRKRVLSENYLRKTASIGLREKRSIKEGHSFSINTEKKHELKEVFGMPGILKKQNAKSSTNEANMAFVRQRFEDAKRLSVNEKLQQSKAFNDVLEDLNSSKEVLLRYLLQSDNSLPNLDMRSSIVSNSNGKHRKTEKTTSRGNILRSLQKLETGFATEPHGNHCLPTKIVILKPNLVKERSAFRSSLSHSSQSGDSKQEFSSPINAELHAKARERGTLKNAFQPSSYDFGVLKGNEKEKKNITPKTRHRISTSSLNVSNSEVRVADTSVNEHEVTLSSKGSTFLREAKERLSERWKMTKVSQEVGTGSCGPTLGEMLSVPDLEERPETLNNRLDKHGPYSQFGPKNGNPELGSPSCTSSNEVNLEDNEENYISVYSGNNALSPNASNFASACSVIDVMADAETKNVELATGDRTEQQSVSMACDMFVKDGHSSHFCDGSAGQESQIGSHEYVVEYLNCMSSGEAYQPSPNSVLEPPFKEDDSQGSHCFETVSTDLQGLWIQLQLLKSESEGTHSEGTGMVVSSDEDTTEKSFHSSSKNVKLMKFLRGESRDFSYLLDVLEEWGLHGGTTLVSFDNWHSPECLLSPSVFEALEKKYSEHSSWSKTERKLLFDRVNAGLMEILKPCLDVHIYSKPLSKKVGNALRRDVIEEEVWTLLISEEREVGKELSAKALGRESWVEFWDDIETIAIDIENFLFDELAAELVGI